MAAKFLGQYLLEEGLIDKAQLLAALDIQRASNPVLGELAQARGMLDAAQAQLINERQRSQDKRFGDIAQALGLLDAAQVAELLALQNAQRKLFGEILLEQGMLSQEQLDRALLAQSGERKDAVQAFEVGVSAHAMGPALEIAVGHCNKLFTRILRTPCQFSRLVASPADLPSFPVTGHVRVNAVPPLTIAIACERPTMANIAGAFLSMPARECDEALSRDALGEMINVLMGYVVKDTVPEDARYRASPPDFGTAIDALMAPPYKSLAVLMVSELGPFVLLAGR